MEVADRTGRRSPQRRGRSAPTSRSCRARSTASRSSTSTTPRPRRSPRAVIEAIDSYYRHSNANIHRGMHELAAEADELYEGGAQQRSPTSSAAGRGDGVRAQRDRGDQPRPLHLGAAERRRGRRRADHRDGAPLERRSLAAAVRGDRRASSSTSRVDADGKLDLDELERQLLDRQGQAGRRGARLERARHDQPGRRDRAPRTRSRRDGARRRRAGGAAAAGRRAASWAPTSTPSPATRCSGRPASACCGRGASCSSGCRRSWAAAR